MINYIYCITNTKNNKVYIGSTTDYSRRIREHFYRLEEGKHKNKHLQSAYNKYGKDNFDVKIVDSIDGSREDGYVLEQKYVNDYILKYGIRMLYNKSMDTAGVSVYKERNICVYDYRGVKVEENFSTYISIKYNITVKKLHRHCNIHSKHVNGYVFRYKDEYNNDYEEDLRDDNRVVLLDPLGNFVKEYMTIKEANKELGLTNGVIKQNIKHNSRFKNNYYFVYSYNYDFSKKDSFLEFNRENVLQHVLSEELSLTNNLIIWQLFDTDGSLVGNFSTIEEMSLKTGIKKGTINTNIYTQRKENFKKQLYLEDRYVIYITTEMDKIDTYDHGLPYYEVYDENDQKVFITTYIKNVYEFTGKSIHSRYKTKNDMRNLTTMNKYKIKYCNTSE